MGIERHRDKQVTTTETETVIGQEAHTQVKYLGDILSEFRKLNELLARVVTTTERAQASTKEE